MNPVLGDKTFNEVNMSDKAMTKNGVINKSVFLWAILAVGAYVGWSNPTTAMRFLMPALLVGFILSLVIVFKKNMAPIFAPIYAFLEGLVLGTITLFFEKDYPGIAVNAVFLTISVLFCMLAAFRAGFIKPTAKLMAIVSISTLAICLLYLIDIIISMCGGVGFTFITSSGTVGILFSIFVVLIASFNLIIDFEFIQRGVAIGAPKYMEWYGAFALMVTIVWLYLEILRLLSKMRNN